MTPENMPGSYARFQSPAPPELPDSGAKMWGLTLSPLWAAAIVHGSKRLENRHSRPIGAATSGQRIFIHAGAQAMEDWPWNLYEEYLARARQHGEVDPELHRRSLDRRSIIGTCRIVGFDDAYSAASGRNDPWRITGYRYGWWLGDVRPITPILARGNQGWWQYSKAEIEAAERTWREAIVSEAALRG